jgi:hypothetical protein
MYKQRITPALTFTLSFEMWNGRPMIRVTVADGLDNVRARGYWSSFDKCVLFDGTGDYFDLGDDSDCEQWASMIDDAVKAAMAELV